MKRRRDFASGSQSDFQSLGTLLGDYDWDKKKYISREFQDYGYRLAEEFNDLKHKSLYIKLAKTEKRELMEKARAVVKDSRNARNKGKLFMWALNKLKRNEPLYENETVDKESKDFFR